MPNCFRCKITTLAHRGGKHITTHTVRPQGRPRPSVGYWGRLGTGNWEQTPSHGQGCTWLNPPVNAKSGSPELLGKLVATST